MRILVLGGTAWLGRTAAVAAVRAGHEVVCLSRGRSGPPAPGTLWVSGDRDSASGYASVPDGRFDTVIDVARDPQHVRTAIEALGARVGHWIFVSSINAYADDVTTGQDEGSPTHAPLAEGTPWTPEAYGPGKVACEQALTGAFGAAGVSVVRPGLIGGPGDPTGRTTYWPHRFARPAAADGTVLVPDVAEQPMQVLDVRDLARWLVVLAQQQRALLADAVGADSSVGEQFDVAAAVAGHTGPRAHRRGQWLLDHGVQHWMGPRSMPLWLPMPEAAAMVTHRGETALTAGLRRRPVAETLADTLAADGWKPGSSGLTIQEERALLTEPA